MRCDFEKAIVDVDRFLSLFAGRTDRLDCQRHIALVEQAERERVPCTHVRLIVRPCALRGSLPFLPDWLCSLPQWLRNYLEVSCLHLPISVLCPFTSAKFMVQKCRMLCPGGSPIFNCEGFMYTSAHGEGELKVYRRVGEDDVQGNPNPTS